MSFFVEPTVYGWSVRDDTERLGLFTTQQLALNSVQKRRVELMAKGKLSRVVVTGSETQEEADRAARPRWKYHR